MWVVVLGGGGGGCLGENQNSSCTEACQSSVGSQQLLISRKSSQLYKYRRVKCHTDVFGQKFFESHAVHRLHITIKAARDGQIFLGVLTKAGRVTIRAL